MPKLFNILVNTVVQEWLRHVARKDVSWRGITEDAMEQDRYILCLFLALFYADDAFLACRNHRMLQKALGALVWLFEKVGLMMNTKKTQLIICIPGKIRTRLSARLYGRGYNRDLPIAASWAARIVECDNCGVELASSLLSTS